VRDCEGEAEGLGLCVEVRELVVLAVPQADSVGVLELVVEADMEPDTVLLLEEVEEAVKEAVLVGDSEGAPEAVELKEALARAEEESEGEAETLGVTLPEPLAEAEGASLAVALGVALPVLDSLRLGRLECVMVTDPVKVTPVGKAVMLTVGVPRCGEAVTVMLTLGELEGDTDTEPLVLGVLELVVEAVMVPEARTVPERRGVPLPQGLEVCVLVAGWLRVCVALTVGVLELEALPVMVTEAVAVLLACALAVKDSVSVEEAEDVRVVTGEGVGGALRVRVPVTEGEPLLRLAVGERLPVRVAV
jgi:hypothetical protein